MKKSFEDHFSEIQADMVSICLEYVDDKADMIYIYCSFEQGVVSSDFFFRINDRVLERHKLNESVGRYMYDVSIERQNAAIEIIDSDIMKIDELCRAHGRDMPTEMKLVYNVKRNSLVAKYKYDLMYSNDPEKTADDIANEWFDEINNSPMDT